MVQHQRFVQATVEMPEGEGGEQEGVTSEPGTETGDGGGGAAQGAGELAMGGAGLQTGGDRKEEFGPLEVVGEGETLA